MFDCTFCILHFVNTGFPDTFDTYDQGKNGAITLSELSFALEKLGVHVRLSQLEDTVRKLSKSGAFKI